MTNDTPADPERKADENAELASESDASSAGSSEDSPDSEAADGTDEALPPGLGNVPEAALEPFRAPKKRPWRLILLILLGAAVLGVILAPTIVSTAWVNEVIEEYLDESIDPDSKVEFASLEVSWFDGVTIHDLKIRPAKDGSEAFFTTRLVELDVSIMALLAQELVVETFVIHDPVLTIEPRPEDEETSTSVVRTRRVKRGSKKDDASGGSAGSGDDEATVLPVIDVPIEVRNLLVIVKSEDGRVAKIEGIDFNGDVTTRDGPTTFELVVPDGESNGITITGEATLFDEIGAILPRDAIGIEASIDLDGLDATRNRDLIALALGDIPVVGRLDGEIGVTMSGGVTDGNVDVVVRGVGVGDAAKRAKNDEDLLVSFGFHRTPAELRLSELVVRGPGVSASGAISGTYAALDGAVDLSIDLNNAAQGLRDLGFDIPHRVAGAVSGELRFVPDAGGQSSTGSGSLRVDDLSFPSADGRRVEVDTATVALDMSTSDSRIELRSLKATAPGFESTTTGAFDAEAGTELITTLAADLTTFLPPLRDAGFVPRDISVNGTVAGRVLAKRDASSGAMTVDVESLTLTDDDVRMELSGVYRADGSLDFTASGRGDLGQLLAGGDSRASAVRGRFEFAATARGTRDEPRIEVLPLRVEGDVDLDASLQLGPADRIHGRAELTSRIATVVDLLRRLGFVEDELPLDGNISAHATVMGTRENPQVQDAEISITDGPLELHGRLDIDDESVVTGTVQSNADLDALLAVLHSAGHLHDPVSFGGAEIAVRSTITGTAEAMRVPQMDFRLTGPVKMNVNGHIEEDAHLSLEGDLSGAAQPLVDLVSSWKGIPTRTVSATIEAAVAAEGTRELLNITASRLLLRSGDFQVDGRVSRRARGPTTANAEIKGSVDDLTSLLREAGIVTDILGDGMLQGSIDVSLSPDRDDEPRVATASAALAINGLRLTSASTPETHFADEAFALEVTGVEYDVTAGELRNGIIHAALQGGLVADLRAAGSGHDVNSTIEMRGPTQPLLDLMAVFGGGRTRDLQGDVAVRVKTHGRVDDPSIEIDELSLTAGTLTGSVSGHRDPGGALRLAARVDGPAQDALTLLAALGYTDRRTAEGTLRVRADASTAGDMLTAKLNAELTNLVLAATQDAPEVREPRAVFAAPSLRFDMAAGRLEPADVSLTLEGAEFQAKLALESGEQPVDGETARERMVTADGTLTISEPFSRNHPDWFSDVVVGYLSGPFRFTGDVGDGRARADTWDAEATLAAKDVTAPYVTIAKADAKAVVAGGRLTLDPLSAIVNDGTIDATGSFGLVGKKPEHALKLTARNVTIDGELSPLLARVTPLLAVGESGRSGGRVGIDADLTARGDKGARIKRTASGSGVIHLDDVYMESTNWLGQLLDLAGAGKRLEVTSAKVPFVVENGRFITQDVPIAGQGLDLRLGGEVGLDGALDYGLGLRPERSGGAFAQYAKLVDPDGYLPLRLKGNITDPKLKLPDVKDVVKDGLKDLWDGLRGDDDDDDDKGKDKDDGLTEEERRARRRERRRRRREEEQNGGTGDGTKNDDDPPPPPKKKDR